MGKLILLISLFCSDNTIFIVTDDSFYSKVITHEIKRNWAKNAPYEKSAVLLDSMRCEIIDKIKIIDFYDKKNCEKFRIPRLKIYPQYRIGDYKDFKEFDERTFTASGSFIQVIYAIKKNSDIDINDWKLECEKIKSYSTSEYLQNLFSWAITNSINEANDLYSFEERETDEIIKEFVKRYSNRKDFPVYVEPKLPENPLVKFPWEK